MTSPAPTPSRRLACAAALLAALTVQAAAEEPVAFTLGGMEVLGDGPAAATLGAGGFNTISREGRDTAAEARLEYRLGRKWNAIGPLAGVLVNSEGGVFGYVAAYADIRLGDRWHLTPAGGVGAYERGDGKDLGGVFQFHLGLDIAYRFESGHRLGLKVTHISNAFIHDRNPGTESVLLTYTLPLGP